MVLGWIESSAMAHFKKKIAEKKHFYQEKFYLAFFRHSDKRTVEAALFNFLPSSTCLLPYLFWFKKGFFFDRHNSDWILFIVAEQRLYQRLCPSGRWSVHPSIQPSVDPSICPLVGHIRVGKCEDAFFDAAVVIVCVCVVSGRVVV